MQRFPEGISSEYAPILIAISAVFGGGALVILGLEGIKKRNMLSIAV
jgi:hypothetical protein